MPSKEKKPWLAGFLSLLVIGMGQIYNKEYKKAIIFWIIQVLWFSTLYLYGSSIKSTSATSFDTIIGLILVFIPWLYSGYDAYRNAVSTIDKKPNKISIWITMKNSFVRLAVKHPA